MVVVVVEVMRVRWLFTGPAKTTRRLATRARRMELPTLRGGGGTAAGAAAAGNPASFLNLFKHDPEAGYLHRRFMAKGLSVLQELVALTQAAAARQQPGTPWEEVWRSNLPSLSSCSQVVQDRMAAEFVAEVPDIVQAARATYSAYALMFYARSPTGGVNHLHVTLPPFSLFLFEYLTYVLHHPLVGRAVRDPAVMADIADSALMDSLRAVLRTRVTIKDTIPEEEYHRRRKYKSPPPPRPAEEEDDDDDPVSRSEEGKQEEEGDKRARRHPAPARRRPQPVSEPARRRPPAAAAAGGSSMSRMSALGEQWKQDLQAPSRASAPSFRPSDSATSLSVRTPVPTPSPSPAAVPAPAVRIIQLPPSAAAAPSPPPKPAADAMSGSFMSAASSAGRSMASSRAG